MAGTSEHFGVPARGRCPICGGDLTAKGRFVALHGTELHADCAVHLYGSAGRDREEAAGDRASLGAPASRGENA